MTTFTIETIDSQQTAAISAEVPADQIRDVFDRGFPAIVEAVTAQGIEITGPPFGYYPRMPGDTIAVVVGFPVAQRISAAGEVQHFELPGGRAVCGTHVGPYEGLADSYRELVEWSSAEGHDLGEVMWECYLTDPGDEPDPNAWQTRLVWPLA